MKSIHHVTIKFLGDDVRLEIHPSEYSNGRVALVAIDDEGERFGTLTVNVPDAELDEDEIIVKTYSENSKWVPQVLAAMPHVFHETGRKVRTGFVECPVYMCLPEACGDGDGESSDEEYDNSFWNSPEEV